MLLLRVAKNILVATACHARGTHVAVIAIAVARFAGSFAFLAEFRNASIPGTDVFTATAVYAERRGEHCCHD